MSLVDAIRHAAAQQSAPDADADVFTIHSSGRPGGTSHTSPSPTPTHGVVRLELMLSPEQLHELLRGLMNGVHSVFTLREAAHYLRMTSSSLTAMAESGGVPGFLIEGKWRFSKTTLDDWMARQEQTVQTNSEASDGD